jgi:release factor-specific protein-(glutamine-N5) methyltransferase
LSKKCNKAKIGGQALLEGVMMRGAKSMALAVRTPSGEILTEARRITPKDKKPLIMRLPFFRGVIAFFQSFVLGMRLITRSADALGLEDDPPTKFELWVERTFKLNITPLIMGLAVVLGVALAVGLFIFLPRFLAGLIGRALPTTGPRNIYLNLIDGGIRLTIFVLYILLVSLLSDIKRFFAYHGAEHKTINAYEHGLELTVENVKKSSKIHDRCGTSFMFFVMMLSILLFTVVDWQDNMWVSIAIRLALLPVVAGLSYELLMFLARFDNWFVKVLKAPGMLLQKLTTKEPDAGMIEVAITSFNLVLAMDNDESLPELSFNIKHKMHAVRRKIERAVKIKNDVERLANVEFIICEVLKVKRSELCLIGEVEDEKFVQMLDFAKKVGAGTPFDRVLGYADFYGLKIELDPHVLSPRSETELLAEHAIKNTKAGARVLDLCTGSGAIAIAVAKNTQATVVAGDISKNALEKAAANAKLNNAEVEFIHSDLFANIAGEFDIIVSNPPYIKTQDIKQLDKNVKKHDPHLSLDGGANGLCIIERIITDAKKHLVSGGLLVIEHGFDQSEQVLEMYKNKGFMHIFVIKDLQGIDRFAGGYNA